MAGIVGSPISAALLGFDGWLGLSGWQWLFIVEAMPAVVIGLVGRSYKTLKRHLTAHGLSPDQYRERYGLPEDYPMTAPGYAAQRSALA
ncbi:MucR family transcriptional regulator, partial [Methylobacterium sp. J-026]|uniref:MucR family transcriptional regulator n=1 Tax=Methylobacterium sp. J-026 TaxID=2836624 RepID=UPI0028C480B2